MRFVTATIHRVDHLASASHFFCTALGFHIKTQTDSSQLLENGSVTIRLSTETHIPFTTLHLELNCRQLEPETQTLLTFTDTLLIAEHTQTTPYRLENRIQAPHNLLITLVKEFNEDEIGIMPLLPTCLDWQAAAVSCIQQLLTYIPIAFRQTARSRITERAEVLAAERGEITVDLADAVQALADTTPVFQHPTLIAALRERAINPDPYFPTPVL